MLSVQKVKLLSPRSFCVEIHFVVKGATPKLSGANKPVIIIRGGYTMESESGKESGLSKEWKNFFALQCKRVLYPDELIFEEYRDALITVIGKILQYEGIDIKSFTYNECGNYQRIRNEQIQGLPGGSMSLEEFIERFLIDREKGCYYISLYDMGNLAEFPTVTDYNDEAIAEDIACLLFPSADEAESHDYILDVLNQFHGKGGLIERMKKYFGIDLDSFDTDNTRNKRERCKILYFFYLLERKEFPRENVLSLLNKPSMENIDNTPLNWETHNGEKVRFIKDSLAKELSLHEKDKIYSTLKEISFTWDNILKNAQILLDFLYDYGFDYSSTKLIQSPLPVFTNDKNNTSESCDSPVERLYLIILQKEYLGSLIDIKFVNKIQNSNNYNVPSDLIEEMKSLSRSPVALNDVERYVRENALKLSRYVYLGKKATKEEVRRISTYKYKVTKVFEFCHRANCLLDIKEIANELQVVSVLQAVILDDQSEEFKYTFHGYQKSLNTCHAFRQC